MAAGKRALTKHELKQKSKRQHSPAGGARKVKDRHLDLPDLGQRGDIQGLRALAIITVVLYHADVPYISGGFIGVDFFFVLSGFLITYLLLKEIQRSGRISFKKFWSRRVRRLIPASLVVLLATVIASFQILPFSEKRAVGLDTIYALFFSANWRFAQQETDYLADDRSPSPLLHFWSLGVEEQFYFIWPVVIALLAFLFIRGNLRLKLTVFFVVTAVASLAFNVYMTDANQPYAFFGTPARAWQLIAGALIALWLGKIVKIPERVKICLALSGLGFFVASIFLLKESGPIFGFFYPSWLALAPTLGAVLLLMGGSGASHFLTKILSIRPLTWFGDISYSLYLWHWPLLVLGVIYFDNNSLETRLALVGAAVVLAFLTYVLVENPVRHWRPLASKPYLSIVVALVALFGAAIPAHALSTYTVGSNVELETGVTKIDDPKPKELDRFITSQVPLTSSTGEGAELKPSVDDASADIPAYHSECQRGRGGEGLDLPDLTDCTFGAKDYDKTVVVTGDSIATATTPAVIKSAEEKGWRVILLSMSACTFAPNLAFEDGKTKPICKDYADVIFEKIKDLKPELVIVANSYGSNSSLADEDGNKMEAKESRELASKLIAGKAKELQDLSIEVALVSPPPRTDVDMIPANCLAEKQDAAACHFPLTDSPDYMEKAHDLNKDTFYVKATSTYCAEDCFPVIRDYIVYRDALHWSETYSQQILTPLFTELLEKVEEALKDEKR